MSEFDHRLTDAQMAQFITHGYVTITPDLPRQLHDEIYARHEEVFEKEGNPGNNLLPRIPLVRQIFDASEVVGALRSVVGDDYYLQPHRHPHHNKAHSAGQQMHQDGGKRWSHRTRYLLAFYYPQDTPLERGPSGIVPGSHLFNTPEGARSDRETPLVTPAGTVTIVDYDLWHRAMPNTTDEHRFMVKFLFARMSEPSEPSWQNRQLEWPGSAPAMADDGAELKQLHRCRWDWHRGAASGPPAPEDGLQVLLARLKSDNERVGVAAAYDLAGLGEEAVGALIEQLAAESEMTQRNAAYGLSAMGAPAVDALSETLMHESPEARGLAASVLGDIAGPAAGAASSLIAATRDPEAGVRRHAAEALGTIANDTPDPVPSLIDAMSDDDASVRTAAVFALCRLGPLASEAVDRLEGVLDDDNRYVRADALFALERIGTPLAKDRLIRHLTSARWCPITTSESTF
mgnify:CR=1 FL=1|jgi:hypothetical protein